MHGAASLIPTLVFGFGLAFVFGYFALKLKLSPIVGYMIAGVVVGPFTPGWVADGGLASELSEIGVILLMFGVGLHFSPDDLVASRKTALPAAIIQVAVAALLGFGLGLLLQMPPREAALFGLCLSVASTVVVMRALEERHAVKTDLGRLLLGWLVVEDLVVIVALALTPLLLAPGGASDVRTLAISLGVTLAKVAAFLAVMLVVGVRVVPWLLVRIAHVKSRELFTLGVLALTLGIAYLAYSVFGASFALGAFVAGLVVSASPLGHAAGERSLPFRDAFAVLFFVSVGMLFDPRIVLRQPLAVAATLAAVVIGNGLIAWAITRLLGRPPADGLLAGAGLGQIGEFSFVLAGLGLSLKAMSRETHDLVLAAALLSMTLNPFAFRLADWAAKKSGLATAT